MVVGIGVDQNSAILDLAAIVNPTAEFRGAINHSLMRNRLWNFDREDEALGSSSLPVFNGASGGACVESRIHFDCMKPFGVESQIVGGLHAPRIE